MMLPSAYRTHMFRTNHARAVCTRWTVSNAGEDQILLWPGSNLTTPVRHVIKSGRATIAPIPMLAA